MDGFTPKNYCSRPGTSDSGRDYEYKMAALLFLRCVAKKSTQHAWFAMNVDECGAFDDVVLYRNVAGREIVYLIQLKHAEKGADIRGEEFRTKKNGPFYLKKYFDDVPKVKTNRGLNYLFGDAKIVFVLFTNRGTTDGCDFLQEIPKSCDLDRKWLLYETLDTTGGKLFEFDWAKLNFGPEEFFLAAKQLHVDSMDGAIANAIKNLIQPVKVSKQVLNDLVMKFSTFVLEWSKGQAGGYFPMTKREIMKKLIELLLEPYRVGPSQNEEKFDTSLWRTLLSDKEVVVINKPDEDVLKFLQRYICGTIDDYKNSSGRVKLTNEEVYEILWKNREIPIILNVNKAGKKQIESIIKVSNGIFKSIILLGEEEVKLKFPAVFGNFHDLKKEHQGEILKIPVKLQGKKSSLQLRDGTNLLVKDIIHLLIGKFNVGGEFEPLPKLFVEINLKIVWLEAAMLNEVKEGFAIAYKSEAVLEKFLENKNVKIAFLNPKKERYKEHNIIILGDGGVGQPFPFTKQNVHFLTLDEASREIVWLDSFGSVENIRHYRKDRGGEIMTAKEFITTTTFHKKYLVSANPGMGKTILLNYIALTISNFWVVKINLPEYKNVFKTWKGSCNLEIFLNSVLDKTIFQHYLESKNVIFLLDAFDEVPISCQSGAKKFIKYINECGHNLIVTTRPFMKNELETLLDTFAIEMCLFTRDQQKYYLENYFASMGKIPSADKTVAKFVRELLDAAENNLNDRDNQFTGVPLQTLLLAEVFEEDFLRLAQTFHFVHKQFDLLYLYRNFIDKKNRIAFGKSECTSEDMIEQYANFRTLYALKLVFSEEELEPLKINVQLETASQFLPNLVQLIQKDGVVVAEDETNIAFVHYTFAEYLVAVWLVTNLKNNSNRPTVEALIQNTFQPSFVVVRNVFDRIVCQNCPLHLAIINRHVDVVQTLTQHNQVLDQKDECGRNFFHIIACWGLHHTRRSNCKWEPTYIRKAAAQDDAMMEIFNTIPREKLRNDPDELFGYTPWDYAYVSGSLNIANAICLKFPALAPAIGPELIDLNYCEAYCEVLNYLPLNWFLLQHCSNDQSTPPAHLLWKKRFENMETLISDQQQQRGDILKYAIVYGGIHVAQLALSHGVDVNAPDDTGMTALHWVARYGLLDEINFLLSKGADVAAVDLCGMTVLHWPARYGLADAILLLLAAGANIEGRNSKGMTALHWATIGGHTDIVRLLVLQGANLNTATNNGFTAFDLAVCNQHVGTAWLLASFKSENGDEEEDAITLFAQDENMNLPTISLHESCCTVAMYLPY